MRQQEYMEHMHRQRRLCAIVDPPRLLPYCGYVFGVTGELFFSAPSPLSPPLTHSYSYDHNA